jgi:hypothetical protein
MGLRAPEYWPNFIWWDPNVPGPTGFYEHWGTNPSNQLEPDDNTVGGAPGRMDACGRKALCGGLHWW